jgi:hypothetical protein
MLAISRIDGFFVIQASFLPEADSHKIFPRSCSMESRAGAGLQLLRKNSYYDMPAGGRTKNRRAFIPDSAISAAFPASCFII